MFSIYHTAKDSREHRDPPASTLQALGSQAAVIHCGFFCLSIDF